MKSQENASLIDAQTVDEIFLMVPDILHIHQQFLEELRRRLEIWEPLQRVGDAFVQVVMSLHLVLFAKLNFPSNLQQQQQQINNENIIFLRTKMLIYLVFDVSCT